MMYSSIYLLGFLLALLFQTKSDHYYLKSLSYSFYIAVYSAIGAIVGGRLGYVLLYEPVYYLDHLFEVIQLYKGGMSFFGGICGLTLCLWLLDRKGFWHNTDHLVLIACIILPLGRIANFCNGELWGTVTDLPWGMVFAGADDSPRHPVQIYEAILEGPALYLCVIMTSYLNRVWGIVSNSVGLKALSFCYFYGLFRFSAEFVREPDRVVGYIWGSFTLGHLLAVMLILFALVIFSLRVLAESKSSTACV